MKKSSLKMIIGQFIFFVIASSYIPINLFLDWYLPRHHLCKNIGEVLSRTCEYDNLIGRLLSRIHNIEFYDKLLIHLKIKTNYLIPNLLKTIFQGSRTMISVAEDILTIAFWMIILNLLHYLLVKVFSILKRGYNSSES